MKCDFEAGSRMHKNRTNELKKLARYEFYTTSSTIFLHWICYWNICNNDEEQRRKMKRSEKRRKKKLNETYGLVPHKISDTILNPFYYIGLQFQIG